jgi:hypothetical protein
MKIPVYWIIAPCSLVEVYLHFSDTYCVYHIALMVEAASTTETSANIYHTVGRNNSEDGHLIYILALRVVSWEVTANEI